MAFNPQNPNGQAPMASSAPVVVASDQTPVPVQLNDVYLALKRAIDTLARPPWIDQQTGQMRAVIDVAPSVLTGKPSMGMGGIWTSSTAPSSLGPSNSLQSGSYNPTDSLLAPLNRDSWANNIRGRIN